MKKKLKAILMFLLPASVCRVLFKVFRVKNIEIGKNCKIGFTYLVADTIKLEAGSRIGHFNYMNIKKLQMGGGELDI